MASKHSLWSDADFARAWSAFESRRRVAARTARESGFALLLAIRQRFKPRSSELVAGSPWRAIALYSCLVAAFLGLADYWYARAFFPPVMPASAGVTNLINRLAWYKAHRSDYNLVFVGDSRTFTDIHPELLDPLLHTSSINLGTFANWFLTQLPFAQDLAPSIPQGTTVIWSIGHANFGPSTGVQRIYPVGFANAVRYLAWGLLTKGLVDNLFYYNPALYFLSTCGDLRKSYVDFLDRPLDVYSLAFISAARAEGAAPLAHSGTPAIPESMIEARARELKQHWQKDPRVAYVDVVNDANRITSLTVFFQRGGYYRIELDPEYFRKKQREFGSYSSGTAPEADPGYWRVFTAILQTFKRNGVSLVVNEVEEAPFLYGDAAERQVYRKFMHDTIEPAVRSYGYPYIRVDFDRLIDDDYFDWDHLNSAGVQKLTPMLAETLAPHIAARAAAAASPAR
jgi:hypothetical protein